MSRLNKLTPDLLLLVKGHYGAFNDLNSTERLARLLEVHNEIGLRNARLMSFQTRMLMKTINEVMPNYFVDNPERLLDLVAEFSKSPKAGHEHLCFLLAHCRLDGADGNPVIVLPKPTARVRERLDATLDDAAERV